MKKSIFAVIIIAIIFGGMFFLRQKNSSQDEIIKTPPAPTLVKVKTAKDSKSLKEITEYPAIISSDSEATLSAKNSGIVVSANIDLGKFASKGQNLVKIDDMGSNLTLGKNNFESVQVQQLEIALKQAKKSEDLADENYDDDKNESTKIARDIAKLQVKNAELSLLSAIDSRNIASPIAGQITEKFVSVGDLVSFGQPLAKITNTSLIKFQFYVEKEKLADLKIGQSLEILSDEQENIPAKIIRISPSADPATKRFLIEAKPNQKITSPIGTILTAKIEIERKPGKESSFILPIPAVIISQNENYIFIAENEKARKINVSIEKIIGETAEIKADLAPEDKIILEGNKFLAQDSLIKIEE
ncbi:MAG: RND family efflux transporter, MFP subunit [Candidatus Moranbacteria bacterium GW2011_GWF2_36_839]|nr:MAG: RND family efflux transporter, MFP subunit [Candidatus Moranbacteria bacterium GW2011_GWF1_36_78]KKQ17570.1 MAG: RND family efflux transporter, MFP subunit [Candidatus Moranbacteria bacterium GW2011_GWF2_36_839]HAT74295.1 hypothetical protein [Candidatus Moranbacteria bacterium]HBY10926.1 hypothetical protein [Candidatus Moranbacteria bacterium]